MRDVSQSNFHHIVCWIKIHAFSYCQLPFQRCLMMDLVENEVVTFRFVRSVVVIVVPIELHVLAFNSSKM